MLQCHTDTAKEEDGIMGEEKNEANLICWDILQYVSTKEKETSKIMHNSITKGRIQDGISFLVSHDWLTHTPLLSQATTMLW